MPLSSVGRSQCRLAWRIRRLPHLPLVPVRLCQDLQESIREVLQWPEDHPVNLRRHRKPRLCPVFFTVLVGVSRCSSDQPFGEQSILETEDSEVILECRAGPPTCCALPCLATAQLRGPVRGRGAEVGSALFEIFLLYCQGFLR